MGTGGGLGGGFAYLKNLKKITEKNKEFLDMFHRMIRHFEESVDKYKFGIPTKVIDLMYDYMKARIKEHEEVENREKRRESVRGKLRNTLPKMQALRNLVSK